MYRLLAIAKYEQRYVIPAAHAEDAHRLEKLATECSLDYEGGPGMGGGGPYGQGPFGESSGTPVPVAGGELPHAARPADRRHASPTRATNRAGSTCSTGTARAAPKGCSRPAPEPDSRRR